MVPSKIVVILQISTNFAPLAHSYMISIITGLNCSTYFSTSIGSLHSSHTVATRLAVSSNFAYGFAISGLGLITSSVYESASEFDSTFSKNTSEARIATHCTGVNSINRPS